MTIIGKSKDGFILQASEAELANLTGYYSQYSSKFWKEAVVGTQVNVSAMYRTLYQLAHNNDAVQRAIVELKQVIHGLDAPSPVELPSKESVNKDPA